MKLITCENDTQHIKNFFSKLTTESYQTSKNNTPRLFGNAHATPTYSIPIKGSSSNTTHSHSLSDINIISPAESVVDQARSEIKHEPKPPALIPQHSPHTISSLQRKIQSHSTSQKRKREHPDKTSLSKKTKKLKKVF